MLALRCVGETQLVSRAVLRWRHAIEYDGTWPEVLRRYIMARAGAGGLWRANDTMA